MTYHELLELFKNDKLDNEQKKQVEADIEKHEAISDYLLESEDIPALGELSLADIEGGNEEALSKEKEQSEQFAKEVRAYITRAFAKAGIIVGVCVLAIVLFMIFGLSKVVDALYYNAAAETDEGVNQISKDIAIYSELFAPGRYRDEVICIPEGYGNYTIYLPDTDEAYSTPSTSTGKVVHNQLTLYNPDILGDTDYVYFPEDVSELKGNTTITKGRQRFNERLESTLYHRNEKAYKKSEGEPTYDVYVTLNQVIPYPEMPFGGNVWIPLCWKNDDGEFENVQDFNIGFLGHGEDIQTAKQNVSAKLRYVNDNKQFSLMADAHKRLTDHGLGLPKDYYAQIAQQIEKHGLYTYGFIAWEVSSYTVIELALDERVTSINVCDSETGYSIAYYDTDTMMYPEYIENVEGYPGQVDGWYDEYDEFGNLVKYAESPYFDDWENDEYEEYDDYEDYDD